MRRAIIAAVIVGWLATALAVVAPAAAHGAPRPSPLSLADARLAAPGSPCAGRLVIASRTMGDRCVAAPHTMRHAMAPRTTAPYPITPAATSQGAGGQIVCIGDGQIGPRVQAVYGVPDGATDRSAEAVPAIRGYALVADATVNASAAKTGGSRHVRFVTTAGAGCQVEVVVAHLPALAATDFGALTDGLAALGLNRTDRHYLVWMDVPYGSYCGLGDLPGNDGKGPLNAANSGPYYARIEDGCWSQTDSATAVHELWHTLGAVHSSAPNATPYGHCRDEADVMCYADGPGVTTFDRCPADQGNLLDCGDDDYFSTKPPAGSYLATHWNTADSVYLFDPANDPSNPSLVTPGTLTRAEGTGGPTSASVPITIAPAAAAPFSFTYAVQAGTAGADDLALATGTIQVTAGQTSASVPITITGDALDEDDETARVVLSNPTGGAYLAGSGGLITILDDDATPTVSVTSTEVTEGTTKPTTLSLAVTLSAPSGRAITVRARTTDQTATAPPDYVAIDTTVAFPPGAVTRSVSTSIKNDLDPEGDETFRFAVSALTNVDPGTTTATITIHDPTPQLSIGDVAVTESNHPVTAAFKVTADLASAAPVTFTVKTKPGSATSPADYGAVSTIATLPAGSKTVTIPVDVVGDALDEKVETFTCVISSPAGATIKDGSGKATITDDDPTPSLSIADVSISEPASGTAVVKATVTSSAPSGQAIAVSWATVDGTATAPADYVAASGSAAIGVGKTTATISVTVKSDALGEGVERFAIKLSSPTNATIANGTAQVSIVDAVPTVTVTGPTVTEGSSGTVTAPVVVHLSAASAVPVTVRVTTSDQTAKAGADYTALDTVVTVPAGATSFTVPVTIAPDAIDEPDETFKITLSAPTGAILGPPTGTVTIVDDDAAPAVSIADASIAEGNTGTRSLRFDVTLSAPSGRTVTVVVSTTGTGTATVGTDYQALAPTTITFTPGTAAKTATVIVNGDTVVEPDETFGIKLSAPNFATIGGSPAIGRILNDD